MRLPFRTSKKHAAPALLQGPEPTLYRYFVEESPFVSTAVCPRTSLRLPILSLLFAAAGFAVPASQAQTAPQLLPYTISKVAGGGAAIASGATCPTSGYVATDAYGDGCLATEVKLNAPRFVTTDKNGVIFFSDSGNALVRRIDPITGIITAVAGGASASPANGTACGTGTSTDGDGDGCLGNLVKISKPEGLAFSPAGDLYFADYGYDNIRKIAATGGVITTTGVISQVAGNSAYGYAVDNAAASGSILAATQSYMNYPYGLTFDKAGNLYFADEGNSAIEVINLTSASETIQGVIVPAGTVAKIAGYGSLAAKSATSGECPNFVSTGSRGGCYFGNYTTGNLGVKSNLDSAYDVAVDPSGNVYLADEYLNSVAQLSPANIISQYAGTESSQGKSLVRATAGTFGIGSNYNVTADQHGNVYTSDAVNGVVWRVDATTRSMYVIAGGASTVCTGAADTYGDGCPATASKLSVGTINTAGFASAPGVAGLFVDPAGDLLITDATTSLVRAAASGTQFGNVGGTPLTNTLDIHFATGDGPARTGAYTITSGSSTFSAGVAACTVNSDATTDCLLPVTVTPPTTLGPFTGTLQVTGSLSTASFTLNGNYVMNPSTRLSVAYTTPSSPCTGTNIYANTTPVVLAATVIATGSPTGTIQFLANGKPIGSPVAIVSGMASLSYTFATPASYTISAMYSGDSYFTSSTGTASTPVVSTLPGFIPTALAPQQNTITAGQTALYSLNLAQSVYAGTISLSCSGLPQYATCQFSPATITAMGCSATSTVALSIVTQQAVLSIPAGLGGGGQGLWALFGILPGFALALFVGLRRRSSPRLRGVLMALALFLIASGTLACSSGNTFTGNSTPAGTYNVTVTATGSTGTVSSTTVQLIVH
jgi:sugar lactone lactonase YvrE